MQASSASRRGAFTVCGYQVWLQRNPMASIARKSMKWWSSFQSRVRTRWIALTCLRGAGGSRLDWLAPYLQGERHSEREWLTSEREALHGGVSDW
ncbi:hypothetical protein E2C01_081542 [Portunus trituberculatus]|uniref:Uncharacterized protein n=1 Tax=Portunus trituberculatus TaxID=210409 RepID=A0A5B7IYG1_PORTR|nr:hypothetical protein [Portunus trituberculatus]